MCARLFHSEVPENIVFTANAILALNIAIKGVIKPGDHVITSSLEHNSVSRPLHYLGQGGSVRFNQFTLTFSDNKYEITLFQDGRAIIKNAIDGNNARSVYTEYIGL